MKIFNVYISKKSKTFQTISIILTISILSYFVIYSKSNYKIVSNITETFTCVLLPSLFPYMLFSNILIYSNYFALLANTKFNNLLKKLFRVSSYSATAIIFGFLFGYPNGARYVNQLYEDKKISYKETEYLLMFVNNSSPAFILSSIGIGMFGNIKIGILLLVSHMLASILEGIIYRLKYIGLDKNSSKEEIEMIDYKLSFDILSNAIAKTVYIMCMIFGFMVIFIISTSYILKILSLTVGKNKYFSVFLLCIMELTCGIEELTSLNLNLKTLILLISFFLGFSSLCINFQIYSCIYKNKFKLKNIIKGKLVHGILSSLITYVLINIPIIYEHINISKSTTTIIHKFNYTNIFNNHIIISCIIFLIHLLFFLVMLKKKRRYIVSLKGG